MTFFIAAIHGIVLGLLVANHKKYGKPHSNKILGLTILLFSFCLAEYGLYTSGLFLKVPHLIASTNVFLFSVPLLMYFYVKSRFSLDIKRSEYLFFLFALIYLILAIPFHALSSEDKLNVLTRPESNYIIFHSFWAFYYLILWMIFGGLGLSAISKRKRGASFSYQEKREQKWIKGICKI